MSLQSEGVMRQTRWKCPNLFPRPDLEFWHSARLRTRSRFAGGDFRHRHRARPARSMRWRGSGHLGNHGWSSPRTSASRLLTDHMW